MPAPLACAPSSKMFSVVTCCSCGGWGLTPNSGPFCSPGSISALLSVVLIPAALEPITTSGPAMLDSRSGSLGNST